MLHFDKCSLRIPAVIFDYLQRRKFDFSSLREAENFDLSDTPSFCWTLSKQQSAQLQTYALSSYYRGGIIIIDNGKTPYRDDKDEKNQVWHLIFNDLAWLILVRFNFSPIVQVNWEQPLPWPHAL